MENIYTKKDPNTISMVEVKPEVITPQEVLPVKEYDYTFLKEQVISIQDQWDEQLTQKQKEIDEINQKQGDAKKFVETLITQSDLLGIKEKSIKVAPVEVAPTKTPVIDTLV